MLAHRERAWAGQLPDVDPALLRWTAAAATLAGAGTLQQAHALIALLPALAGVDARPLRERLIRWWADAVPGPRLLNPVQPDRLGDHLAAATLVQLQDSSAGAVLDGLVRLPSVDQLGTALELLGRLRARRPDLAEPIDAMVLRDLSDLARRASGAPPWGAGDAAPVATSARAC